MGTTSRSIIVTNVDFADHLMSVDHCSTTIKSNLLLRAAVCGLYLVQSLTLSSCVLTVFSTISYPE